MNVEVKFDFNRSESFRIYPKKNRKKFTDISSKTERTAMTALKACEKELKFIMDVANDRGDDINKLVKESAEAGYHLVDAPFIPEYLGFIEAVNNEKNIIRVYGKQGFNMTHVGDSLYLIYCPNGEKPTLRIRNMYEAIIVLGSIGIDLNFEDYFSGKYSNEEPIESVVTKVFTKIAMSREDDKLFCKEINGEK